MTIRIVHLNFAQDKERDMDKRRETWSCRRRFGRARFRGPIQLTGLGARHGDTGITSLDGGR